MDIDALSVELAGSHTVTGPYDADAETAASQLNAVNLARLVSLSMTEVREWAAVNARAFNLRAAIDNEALTDQVRNLAILGDTLLGTDDGQLDPSNAIHVGMVNELVAAGVWSTADKTALVAKATEDISRATELGFGTIHIADIEDARRT